MYESIASARSFWKASICFCEPSIIPWATAWLFCIPSRNSVVTSPKKLSTRFVLFSCRLVFRSITSL
jgi:hypothetical protein